MEVLVARSIQACLLENLAGVGKLLLTVYPKSTLLLIVPRKVSMVFFVWKQLQE